MKHSLNSISDANTIHDYMVGLPLPKRSYTVNIKSIRSPEKHRRFFKMIRDAYKLFDTDRTFDQFRTSLTCEAGYYEECVSFTGEIYVKATSINYESLDEDEFQDLHSKVLDVIINNCGFSSETQKNFILNYNVPHIGGLHADS